MELKEVRVKKYIELGLNKKGLGFEIRVGLIIIRIIELIVRVIIRIVNR